MATGLARHGKRRSQIYGVFSPQGLYQLQSQFHRKNAQSMGEDATPPSLRRVGC
jgi:hypothetical protein